MRTADGGFGRWNVAPGLGDSGKDGNLAPGLGDEGRPTRGTWECSEVADSGSASVGAWDMFLLCV